MSISKKKIYEYLLLVNSIQEHAQRSQGSCTPTIQGESVTSATAESVAADKVFMGFKTLLTSLSTETNIETLTQVFPILLATITTNLETYVTRHLKLAEAPSSATTVAATAPTSATLHTCRVIFETHKVLITQIKVAASSSTNNPNRVSELLQLMQKQTPLFGRIVFCATVLLENLKSTGTGHVYGAKTATDSLRAVVVIEYTSLLLDVISNSLYPWSQEYFVSMQTAAEAGTPGGSGTGVPAGVVVGDSSGSGWEMRPLLPRSLTGPYLAQLIELLLHFSSRLTPPASLDIRRVSCQGLSALNLLVEILMHCPTTSTATNATTSPHGQGLNAVSSSFATTVTAVRAGQDQDPSVWRTYFPGVYSALQGLALDKTRQRGSKVQTTALLCILTLATAVMADSINSSSIRSCLVGANAGVVNAVMNETAESPLPEDQMHHFDLLMSKMNMSVGIGGVEGTRTTITTSVERPSVPSLSRTRPSGAESTTELPEPTEVSLSWRTDLLQRLSAHFPIVFRHAYCTVNAKHKVLLIEKLCEFTVACKEFLGANGLGFVIPLLLLGFTATTTTTVRIVGGTGGSGTPGLNVESEIETESDVSVHSNSATSMTTELPEDAGGAGSALLASSSLALLEDLLSGSSDNSGGSSGTSSSSGNDARSGGRIVWEQHVKSILSRTLAVCTQQLIDIASRCNSDSTLLLSSHSGGHLAGSSDSMFRTTLSVAIGCLFLLSKHPVRKLFSLGADDPTSCNVDKGVDIGKKFIYTLIYLMTPVGSIGVGGVRGAGRGVSAGGLGSTVTLLEERKYCAITKFEAGSSGTLGTTADTSYFPVFNTVTTGYYRLSWEHISDSEGRALTRRLCFFLGKYQLITVLLATVKSMESCVHVLFRKGMKENRSRHRDASGGETDTGSSTNNPKHRSKSKSKSRDKNKSNVDVDADSFSSTTTTAAAGVVATQVQDSAATAAQTAANVLSVRVQGWCQSISIWKLIGFSVLGCCASSYDRLSPESSRVAVETQKQKLAMKEQKRREQQENEKPGYDKKATSASGRAPQCAVCLRFESRDTSTTDSSSDKLKKPAPLSRCTRCKAVHYCCREHQMKDWASHKLVCKSMTAPIAVHAVPQAAVSSSPNSPTGSSNPNSTCNSGVRDRVSLPLYLEHHLVDPEVLLVSPTVMHCVHTQAHCTSTGVGTGVDSTANTGSKTKSVPGTRAPFSISLTAAGVNVAADIEPSDSAASAVGAVIDLCLVELQLYLDYTVVAMAHSSEVRVHNSLVVQSRNGPFAGTGVGSSTSSGELTFGHAGGGEGSHAQQTPAHSSTAAAMSPLEQSLMSVRMSHILECLGHCAFVLHRGFRRLLLRALYVLLELSVDTNFVVKQAAGATLLRVALYCGYASVKELYRDNLDYIIDPLCAQLRRNRNQVTSGDGQLWEGQSQGQRHGQNHVFTNSILLNKLAALSDANANDKSKGRSKSKSDREALLYSSFRAPAIVDLVFGHFGQEAYASVPLSPVAGLDIGVGNSSNTGIVTEGIGVSLVLLRDMVGDTMQILDSLASTQMLHQEQVRGLLKVLQIIANRAVQLPLSFPSSSNSWNSSTATAADTDTDTDTNSLTMIVSSYAFYLKTLDSLDLPGSTCPDPDVVLVHQRKELQALQESQANRAKDAMKEEEDDPLADVDMDALKQRSPGLVLLLDVLKRCAYFVASGQLDAQIIMVKTMRACIERLAPCPRLFLPAVHQAWSPLMSRVREQLSIVQFYYNHLGPVSPPPPLVRSQQHRAARGQSGNRKKGMPESLLFPTAGASTKASTNSLLMVTSSAAAAPSSASSTNGTRDSSLLQLETSSSGNGPVSNLLSSALLTASTSTAAQQVMQHQNDHDFVSNPLFLKRKLHLLTPLLELLSSIAVLTGDFVAGKMEDDLFPLLLDMLTHLSRETIYQMEQRSSSSSSNSTTGTEFGTTSSSSSSSTADKDDDKSRSNSSIECQVKLAIVSFLLKCVSTLDCQQYMAKLIPSCSVLLLPFLSSVEPRELREQTCALYRAFYVVNPSTVTAIIGAVVEEHAACTAAAGAAGAAISDDRRGHIGSHSRVTISAGTGTGVAALSKWMSGVTDARVHLICRGLFIKTASAAAHNALLQIKQSYAGQRATMLLEGPAGYAGSSSNSTSRSLPRFKVGSFGGLDVFPSDRVTETTATSFTHLLGHLVRNRGLVDMLLKLSQSAFEDSMGSSSSSSSSSPSTAATATTATVVGMDRPIMTAVWKKSIERNTHM